MNTLTNLNKQQIFDELGLVAGDHVVCHSFTPSIGRKKADLISFLEALLERIGPEGTLCAPAFTYSAMRGEIFDLAASKSRVGVLSDLLREMPGAKRSCDANFSYVCLGGMADALTVMDTHESFGENSFFAKLGELRGKALLLGVDFDSLPYFMYLEKMLKVPYRYNKTFSTDVRLEGQLSKMSFVHFVRDLEQNFDSDRLKMGSLIDESQDCRVVDLIAGKAKCVPLEIIKNIVYRKYQVDPHCMIKTIG